MRHFARSLIGAKLCTLVHGSDFILGVLKYYRPLRTSDNVTYSIDKLILEYSFCSPRSLDDFLVFLSLNRDFEYRYAQSARSPGVYFHRFNFFCENGASFWVGVQRVKGNLGLLLDARIEFNPNKCFDDYVFARVINQLYLCSDRRPRLVRFDLAVDIPVLRQDCFLFKDQRLYEEVRKSDVDRTQYLGQRNKPGRVKVYNKQLESDLSCPMTRLEITIGSDRSYSFLEKVFPKLIIIDDLQLCFSDFSLNDTDRFIVKTVLLDPERISELGRRQKEKTRRILDKYTRAFHVNAHVYSDIVSRIDDFCQLVPVPDFLDPWTGRHDFVDGIFI